jgi:hypothetical protein
MAIEFPNKVDTVVIGTSPIALAAAIQYGLRGRKVLVLEERERIGGAWGGETICGIPDVDIGAHDLVIDLENGEFLGRKFQVELLSVRDGFLPLGGCAKLSKRLEEIAMRAGIVIRTSCHVKNVVLRKDGGEVSCELLNVSSSGPFTLKAEKVIKTDHATFPIYLESLERQITSPISPVTKGHIYFIVKDPDRQSSKEFYVPKFDWEKYSRICNLTSFVKGLEDDERMYVVEYASTNSETLSNDLSNLDSDCDEVISILKNKGFLSNNAQRIASDFKSFKYSSNPLLEDYYEELYDYPSIDLVPSTTINCVKWNWLRHAEERLEYSGKELFSIGLVQAALNDKPSTSLERFVRHPLFHVKALALIGDFW